MYYHHHPDIVQHFGSFDYYYLHYYYNHSRRRNHCFWNSIPVPANNHQTNYRSYLHFEPPGYFVALPV